MKRERFYLVTIFVLLCACAALLAALTAGAEGRLNKYDLNEDGEVTVVDVTALLNYLDKGCEHRPVMTARVAPTCTAEGVEPYPVCEICGQVLGEIACIEKLPHTAVTDEALAPTCTETGLTEGSRCAVCGEILVEQSVIEALGHDYEYGVCTRCGDRLPASDVVCTLNGDGGSYTVTGLGNCTDAEVILPAEIDGKPVTAIGDAAFNACAGIERVIIPEGIEKIGKNAFSGCTGLTEARIPDSVVTIGNYAFSNCTGLTEVRIGNGVTTIYENAFSGCTALARVVFGRNIATIYRGAFNGCDSLAEVFYAGSPTRWQKVTIGLENDPLISAAKVYNYTGD